MTMRSLAIVPLFALALTGLTACGGGKSSNANTSGGTTSNTSGGNTTSANGSAANATIPNCGAVQAVWVNLNTKVYHEPGDQYYGKTKNGEYLCPSAAKAQGFHPAGGATMMNSGSNSHHRKRGGSSDSSP